MERRSIKGWTVSCDCRYLSRYLPAPTVIRCMGVSLYRAYRSTEQAEQQWLSWGAGCSRERNDGMDRRQGAPSSTLLQRLWISSSIRSIVGLSI